MVPVCFMKYYPIVDRWRSVNLNLFKLKQAKNEIQNCKSRNVLKRFFYCMAQAGYLYFLNFIILNNVCIRSSIQLRYEHVDNSFQTCNNMFKQRRGNIVLTAFKCHAITSSVLKYQKILIYTLQHKFKLYLREVYKRIITLEYCTLQIPLHYIGKLVLVFFIAKIFT